MFITFKKDMHAFTPYYIMKSPFVNMHHVVVVVAAAALAPYIMRIRREGEGWAQECCFVSCRPS